MRIAVAIMVGFAGLVALVPSSPAPWIIIGNGLLVVGDGPQNVTADFTEDGQGLIMAWDAPDSGTAPTGYRIYRDGETLDDTASLTYTDDLSAWDGAVRNYQVVVLHGIEEGGASLPVLLSQVVPDLDHPECPILRVAVGSEFPFVRHYIREECLPD